MVMPSCPIEKNVQFTARESGSTSEGKIGKSDFQYSMENAPPFAVIFTIGWQLSSAPIST